MTDAPELPTAACPGSPEQIDHNFSYSTGVALLQILVKRDEYFPSAHYFHDEFFLGSIFLHILYFGTLKKKSVQLNTCLYVEKDDEQRICLNSIL